VRVTGGSSNVRFAVYEAGEALRRQLNGKIDHIGASSANLIVSGATGKPQDARG
jgi:hypothetical protein